MPQIQKIVELIRAYKSQVEKKILDASKGTQDAEKERLENRKAPSISKNPLHLLDQTGLY